MPSRNKIDLLAVARWPLGGIRTYIRYVYKYLRETCNITILAASTPEDSALIRDAEAVGARLIVCNPCTETRMFRRVIAELLENRYDVIQSHGFISLVHAYYANLFFRVPHVLTVHGILEERYLKGRAARIKRYLLARIMENIDAVNAVSDDIMRHLFEELPALRGSQCKGIVIRNGVDIELFDGSLQSRGSFRKKMGLDDSMFLIGFLGRFMPEKGFNYLIDAAEILDQRAVVRDFKVLAVGSGAYLDWYKKTVSNKGLEQRFIFIPFQDEVAAIYRDIDVAVMPSVWEAFPLQPMEALCSGIPLVVSDCMGLREAVRDTPAVVFKSKDPEAFAEALYGLMTEPRREVFELFQTVARERFDVRKTAERLQVLFMSLIQRET